MQIFKTKNLYLVVLALMGVIGAYYGTVMAHKNWVPKSELILNEAGEPTCVLLDLLKVTGIEHDGTLGDIVAKTQAEWLRKPGQERWDLGGKKIWECPDLQALLVKCGCVGEVDPVLNQYDYALVMGALASTMRKRLGYAIQLWKNGIRFKYLIMLGGERPRMEQENEADILGIGLENDPLVKKEDWVLEGPLPATESQIMRVLYEQADLPKDFAENVVVVFVDAPMKLNKDGKLLRPTTADTFEEWLKGNPSAGTCLIISNNPYIGYQDSVARAFIPNDFKIESVGANGGGDTKISVHLDNLARWLYQEYQRRKC